MSAIPQTLEEVSKSLQKFIDHPRTLEFLQTRAPRMLAEFRGNRPHGYISPKLAKNYDDSWKMKITGIVWVNLFFVAPMSDGQSVLTIFAESEIEGVLARFGLWNTREATMREIETSKISKNLGKMQYILSILVEGTLRGYKIADIPEYI